MNRRVVFPVLTLMMAPALATDAPNAEVAHLLSVVAASSCVFIRNGKQHTADEAVKHLEMKYHRVSRRIDTAETFIDRIASESSLTGKPYLIDCDGAPVPTRQWLTAKLAEYRDEP